MKHILALILVIPFLTFCYGQTVISEIDLRGGHIDAIQAFPLADSVFLCFSHRDAKKSYWISKDGKKREVNMVVQPNAPIVGVLQGDHLLYYYYLNNINGQLVLQVLEQAPGSEELNFARPIFPIAGELLGINAEKGLVTVVSYLRKQNRIRILRLEGIQILHENFFDMPLDVSRHLRSNSGFISGKEMISLQQAEKKLKLYHDGSDVVITIDQNQAGLDRETMIIRMNVASGAQQVYTLPRNDYDKFVSFYFKNKVYQLSHAPKKYIRFDAFDLKSGKILFSKTFEKDKSMQDKKVIVHRGKSVEVSYSTLYEMVTISETPVPSIIAQTTADSTQLRLSLGAVHYYEEPIIIPFPLPLLNPSVLISLIIMPENSNVRYFTLAGSTESGFEVDPIENNPAPTIRQRIDEYEISQTSGKAKGATGWDLLFKGYAELTDGVVGIYFLRGKKIMLVKYLYSFED